MRTLRSRVAPGVTGARRYDAFLTDLLGDGELRPLHELAHLIAQNEELTGEPLVVDLPVGAPVSTQKLLASLGVVVRFVDAPPPPRRRRGPTDDEAVREVVRRAVADADPADLLARQARRWLARDE